MSVGMDVVTKLQALSLGTYGTDLFLDEMPENDPHICTAVFESGGQPPDLGFGVPGIQYEHPTIAVWFRGVERDSAGPQARARTAYLELPKVQGTTLNGTLYHTLVPMQPPFLLERDSQGRCIYVVNVLADKQP